MRPAIYDGEIMIRILGIDPGSRITGFGVVEADRQSAICVASGCVNVAGDTLAERLQVIFKGISEIVDKYQPHEVAVEQVYVNRNVDSALKLGQARGVAICAVANKSIPVFEYTPSQIKQSVVGRGNAAKSQVQHMVSALLNLNRKPQADAADALAMALCHSHFRHTLAQLPGVSRVRRGRLR